MTNASPDPDSQSEHNNEILAALAQETTTNKTLAQWAKAAAVRAIRTAAQTAVGVIPVSAATIGGVDWIIVAGAAALAAITSLLTSIAGIPEISDGQSLRQIISK
ncbi:MAG: holin [Bifidobacterium tibiigranuli]|jgi:fatty acid desaturase|uniref:holin n=1 Tax=Bifidobacterium tibiigranuli TaxID=2172043 RepID=UPI0023554058|nr:holin [Bifidobacterium tibiigranuli]MCH3975083.1 holin [Bifidobacterium tibiigranuli]MCH4202841.1 holin [Bifidobacterium tibiigranuli]MCH4274907.1 holin [Bifidobacterium tibiigranuli]